MSLRISGILSLLLVFGSCRNKPLPNQEMIDLLKVSARIDHNHENIFSTEALVKKANALLQLGEEQKAIDILEGSLQKISPGDMDKRQSILKNLAIAYLRLGERANCIQGHTAASCIFPIAADGVHHDKTG